MDKLQCKFTRTNETGNANSGTRLPWKPSPGFTMETVARDNDNDGAMWTSMSWVKIIDHSQLRWTALCRKIFYIYGEKEGG